MTKHQHKYQPGPIFQDVFLGGLRALGTNTRDFATKHGLHFQVLRHYGTGHSNGPKALAVRDLMIEEIGPDLFDAMYQARMQREAAR